MYTLYKEWWFFDEPLKEKKHEVKKERCSTLEIARERMTYDFERISNDYSKLLLNNSFITIHYNEETGKCDRMIQYGILQD